MTIKALIFCQVQHKYFFKVIEEFKNIPEIKKVFSLTGDYDILAEIEVESSDELYDAFAKKIDLIDGIIETNTHVIMRSFEK
ncbi:MAG: Lrp/AsnC family transcriptional regulator [Promethearchaeota archaeon]